MVASKKDFISHNEKLEKIKHIFKPWGGFGYESTITYRLLDTGLLSFKIEKIEILRIPNEDFVNYRIAGTEMIPHINLKYTASKLLNNLGEEKPLFEYNLYDVFSPKLKIRIECGHTEPDRLLHCILNDIKFWLLQYPEQKEEKATLYKFFPEKNCKNVLKKYYARGMNTIANLMLEQYDPKE